MLKPDENMASFIPPLSIRTKRYSPEVENIRAVITGLEARTPNILRLMLGPYLNEACSFAEPGPH